MTSRNICVHEYKTRRAQKRTGSLDSSVCRPGPPEEEKTSIGFPPWAASGGKPCCLKVISPLSTTWFASATFFTSTRRCSNSRCCSFLRVDIAHWGWRSGRWRRWESRERLSAGCLRQCGGTPAGWRTGNTGPRGSHGTPQSARFLRASSLREEFGKNKKKKRSRLKEQNSTVEPTKRYTKNFTGTRRNRSVSQSAAHNDQTPKEPVPQRRKMLGSWVGASFTTTLKPRSPTVNTIRKVVGYPWAHGTASTFVPWVLQESSPWLQRPRLSLMTRKPEVISSWMSQERSMWSRADSRSGAPEWTRGNQSSPQRRRQREHNEEKPE